MVRKPVLDSLKLVTNYSFKDLYLCRSVKLFFNVCCRNQIPARSTRSLCFYTLDLWFEFYDVFLHSFRDANDVVFACFSVLWVE